MCLASHGIHGEAKQTWSIKFFSSNRKDVCFYYPLVASHLVVVHNEKLGYPLVSSNR
jgi:hypothetical protein